MAKAIEEKAFPCREKGCRQVVCIETQFAVRIQTGCCSTGCCSKSTVFRCPGCGRLYWGENGEAVLSRGLEKAFVSDREGLVNRPLDADEKASLVKQMIDSTDGVDKGTADYTTFQLTILHSKGHSEDCAGKTAGSSCSCGHASIQEYLKTHPLAEEYK